MKKTKWTVLLLVLVLALGLSSFMAACGGEETTTTTAAPATTAPPTTAAATPDIVDTAVAAGSFTTLVSLVQAAGLVDTLKGEGPFTVFAPTDEAFAAVPKETLDALAADPTGALTSVLTYHVVPGKVMSTDITDGMEATTVEGSTIKLTIKDGMVYVNDAKVIQADIVTSNGVIHVIDAVLLPPTGVEDTGQTYNLKMSFHVPSRASIVEAYYTPWTEAVAAATNGRVTIEMYAEETLVKEADQYDAVLSGLADIASIAADATPGRFPLSEFYGLPQLFDSVEQTGRVYWDILHDSPAAAEWTDVVILGCPGIAPAQYFGNKEAKLPADIAGQRVRSGAVVEGWLIEELGGTPVEISTGELATSMERGIADSCFLSYSFGLITGIKDVTKYRTELDMFYRVFALIMNKDVWESMPKVLQDQIMSVSNPDAFSPYNAKNEELALEDKAAIEGSDKGAGNPPIYVPTAEEKQLWEDAAKPVWDRWVQTVGGDAQAVLDQAVQLVGKYPAQ